MQPLKRPPADLLVLIALLAVVVAIAVTLPACAAYQRLPVQAPPERLQGPAPVVYLQAGAVAKECGNPLYVSCAIPTPEGVAGPDWRIVTPDPCTYDEAYARLVCHELAHAQGWTREHERK